MAAVTMEAIDEALAQVQAAKVDIPNIPKIDQATGQIVPEPPKVVDPLGTDGRVVKTGDVLTTEQRALLAGRRYAGVDNGGCGQRCAGVPKIGAYGYCQRKGQHGPELPHVVVTETGEVAWAWVNGELPVDPTPDVLDDPADAKVEAFTQGMRVNYRNKRDILYVLAVPKRRDESVEIVDLTHQRMRKIRKDVLVPAREDDPQPTQAEMRWMGEFIAARRQSALDIALRELENGRWTRAQMNESLKKIDIAPRPTRYGTSFSVTVDLVLPPGVTDLGGMRDYAAVLKRVMEAGFKAERNDIQVKRVHDIYGGTVTEVR
jgi:hypothetical protein